jgi:hypothetical protein
MPRELTTRFSTADHGASDASPSIDHALNLSADPISPLAASTTAAQRCEKPLLT